VIRRAELAPRWIAVALIVAACLIPLYQPQTPGNFTPAVLGLVWVILGAHFLARGGQTASHRKEPRPRAAS
jgi:hypothetical protein